MGHLIENPAFHHVEVPCGDIALAERFYSDLFGATVYMRRDSRGRPGAPIEGSVSDAEARGYDIDASFLKIGENFRLGLLRRPHEHSRREIDHLAFVFDCDDLVGLSARLAEKGVEIVHRSAERLQVRDPFGLVLELWPRRVLEKMGLL